MWHFCSPRIIFGESSLSSLEEIPIARALVVTDSNLVQIGLVETVLEQLKKTGGDIRIFDQVKPDPTLDEVDPGADAANDFQPDWIIGLGGGSPIDVAKAIWVLHERPDLDLAMINPFIQLGLRQKSRLITIPTTSGSGSDATWGIVLSDPEDNRKLGLGNREITPDIAIVDPALAATMPPRLTADTGLDALTHAIEAYICTWHTDITDGLCLNASRDVLDYLPIAYEASQSDYPNQERFTQAREKMHTASTCAGLGFSNAMASLAHAMGHVLGSFFDISHGQAVGLCLPYTIEFALRGEDSSRIEGLSKLLGIPKNKTGSGQALADHLRKLIHLIENPISLKEAGIDEELFNKHIDKIVDDTFNDTQIITAPRAPNYEQMEKIYQFAYQGRPVDF